jgi:hypothetical protein
LLTGQAAWGTRQEGEEENGVREREREYFPVWILGLHDTVYHVFFSSFHHFRRLRMNHKMVVWKRLMVRTTRGWFFLFLHFFHLPFVNYSIIVRDNTSLNSQYYYFFSQKNKK